MRKIYLIPLRRQPALSSPHAARRAEPPQAVRPQHVDTRLHSSSWVRRAEPAGRATSRPATAAVIGGSTRRTPTACGVRRAEPAGRLMPCHISLSTPHQAIHTTRSRRRDCAITALERAAFDAPRRRDGVSKRLQLCDPHYATPAARRPTGSRSAGFRCCGKNHPCCLGEMLSNQSTGDERSW